MMELKSYQREALDDLRDYLDLARAGDPARAWELATDAARKRALENGRSRSFGAYRPLEGMETTPYVCIRLPTGGGKTLLATETIPLSTAFMGAPRPLVVWFAPTKIIVAQTVEALTKAGHPLRERLHAAFAGRVRVFDVSAFETITPQDIASNCCIVVSTLAAFNVEKTEGRRVYAHNEAMEPHFAGVGTEGFETVSAEEAAGNDMLTAGRPKFSFANLLRHHRPLMIVDEGHRVTSPISRTTQARLAPRAVIEFTATPTWSNNVLFSATATALKEEEMIKLPIRARIHASWRDAVSATIARRAWLEEAADREAEHLRPVALYQARPKNAEPTVEDIRLFLTKERMIPAAHVVVATGDQRGLDGVNLTDPTVRVRHVITVDALKEGWDCPSAYVLCATQNLSSATAVEQILGRILRMPYAARRKGRRLNEAYAEIVEGDFTTTATALRDKLLSMGFTDEEAAAGIVADAPQADDQGRLFDPRPDPRPVVEVELPAPPPPEEAEALVQAGATIVQRGDRVIVAVAGEVTEGIADVLRRVASPEQRAEVDARLAAHAARVERHRSPADLGAAIELPLLGLDLDGEVIDASTDSLWERSDWRLPASEAVLSDAELSLTRSAGEVVMDVEAGEVVHRLAYRAETPGLGLPEGDPDALRTQIVRHIARECRSPELVEAELEAWIGTSIAALERDRGLTPDALADWQDVIGIALRRKIVRLRAAARQGTRETMLFGADALPRATIGTIRLDGSAFANQATEPLPNGQRFSHHLYGTNRMQRLDGKPLGEEFQCAVQLDALEAVEVWCRNIARHPDAFWLPKAEGRFYPDFVARLTDGRLMVVEYKGEDRSTNDDTKDKDRVGRLWAEATGNVYATVFKALDGKSPAEQMMASVNA